ncbi:MAG: putative primase/helicase [Verrucomicrobiota bacterium]
MIGVVDAVKPEEIPDVSGAGDYPVNDTERAWRFAETFRGEVRYVQAWKQWVIWDNVRWRPDNDGAVFRKAQQIPQMLLREASEIADVDRRKKAAGAAIIAGNQQKLQAMIGLAQCQPGIAATPAVFDSNPMLLGVLNGAVDLRTGIFRDARKEDFMTKHAGTAYDPVAECPTWDAFLATVLNNDAELIAFIQRAVGYSLTGNVSEQCLLFLYGSGQNGKSTFAECLQHLFGGYALKTATSLYTLDHNGREPEPAIARLLGRRFVTGSETEEGTDLAESRVKDLTGGDTLTGRLLHCAAFNFKPTHKLWIYGNHRPNVRGNDHGIWRRIKLVPFRVQIPDYAKDPNILKKMAGEMPGILNWAIKGCIDWQKRGLGSARVVEEATADYREEEDELGEFLSEMCLPQGRIERGDLYFCYKMWAEGRGTKFVPKQTTFSKRIRERPGITPLPGNAGGKRYWHGVSLRDSDAGRSSAAVVLSFQQSA